MEHSIPDNRFNRYRTKGKTASLPDGFKVTPDRRFNKKRTKGKTASLPDGFKVTPDRRFKKKPPPAITSESDPDSTDKALATPELDKASKDTGATNQASTSSPVNPQKTKSRRKPK